MRLKNDSQKNKYLCNKDFLESKSDIKNHNLGFMFAPSYHPAMKYAMNVRNELKLKTVFNQIIVTVECT